jgi:hypothetical protein
VQALVIDRVYILIRVEGTFARTAAILVWITGDVFPPVDKIADDVFTNRVGTVFTSLGICRIPRSGV